MENNCFVTEIREFVRTEFNVPKGDPDFTDDVHLFDYGYVDSFGAVTLTGFVEKKFSITITEGDLIAFPLNTIREIASFAEKRKKGVL
jgi:D-alanine--poly(phosphoribitol) ligase subunit 2